MMRIFIIQVHDPVIHLEVDEDVLPVVLCYIYFRFVSLSSFAFTEAATFRSIVLRSLILCINPSGPGLLAFRQTELS